MREIKALTSMRGIFALWVVLFHMLVQSPIPAPQMWLVSRGYIAVDFFFMLSGFILAGAHSAEFGVLHFRSYLRFIARRAGRLFPLHWAVMATVLIGLAATSSPMPWRGTVLREALLVHRWIGVYAPRVSINGPDWSISTEWAANLLFPLFILAFLRSQLRALLAAFTSVIALFYVVYAHGWTLNAGGPGSGLPLLRCFSEFGIGVLIYRYRARGRWFSSDKCLIALAVTTAILLSFDGTDIFVALGLPLLIAGVVANQGIVSSGLTVGPLHWLGRVSYSIYLTQLPLISIAKMISAAVTPNSGIATVVYCITAFVLILFVSEFAYRWIERPCQVGIKKFLQQRTKDSQAESSAQGFGPRGHQ